MTKRILLIMVGMLLYAFDAQASCSNTNIGNGLLCNISITGVSTDGGNTASTAAFTSSGNLAIVSIRWSGSTAPTVSDNMGNSYVPLTAQQFSSSVVATQLWYNINPFVGSGHIVTCTGGTFCGISVAFYSTPVPYVPDTSNGASANVGTTSIGTGSITPTKATNLIIGSCGASANAVPTMTTLTTAEAAANTPGESYGGVLSYLSQGSASAISSTCSDTMDQSGGISATIQSFVATNCIGSSPHWSTATPAESAVFECLTILVNGDMLTIGPGTAFWTTELDWSPKGAVTIVGSTNCTGSGNPMFNNLVCTDGTSIIDHTPHPGLAGYMWDITGIPSGKLFRMSGLTIGQDVNSKQTDSATLHLHGYTHSMRLDHNHFVTPLQSVIVSTDGWLEGVIDHSYIQAADNSPSENGIQINHGEWGGRGVWGDGSFEDNPKFGSSEFIFIEDSKFFGGFANDIYKGGRMVLRYNTMFHTEVQGHETSDRFRGTREWQIYGNNAQCDPTQSSCGSAFMFVRSGTGLMWGNTVTNVDNFMQLNNDRTNSGHGFPTPPNGWGYCGVNVAGPGLGPSGWDTNIAPPDGYRCIDQVGAGKTLPISSLNYWPITPPASGGLASASEPVYDWLNVVSLNGSFGGFYVSNDIDINQNRDYYLCTSGGGHPGTGSCRDFNGTVGVGSGLYANRPTTCTQGTAYWATDMGGNWNKIVGGSNNGELFVCNNSNTFTPYYTPYTYPNPLTTLVYP